MTINNRLSTLDEHCTDLRLEEYVAQCSDGEPLALAQMARKANLSLVQPRMMSGHVQGRLLKMLVRLRAPRRILELGTYSAYATSCMAEALGSDGRITTIELFDELEPFIREMLQKTGVAAKVDVIIGDALEVLPNLPLEEYEMVYLDANKRLYVDYFELIEERLPIGALIVADNTLWDGKVIDSSQHDAQTEGIRAFNDLVACSTRFEKVMIPLRDGLTLIYKVH